MTHYLFPAASFGLFAVLFCGLYKAIMGGWNYRYCVLFIIVYLLWRRREELSSVPSVSSWYGLIPVLFGVLLYWFGEVGGEYYTLYISSWLILAGLCWMQFGWEKVKALQFVFILMLAMFPLPQFAYTNIVAHAQIISSQAGAALIRLCGIPVHIGGNIIDLGVTRLTITGVDAVVGQVVSTIALGFIFACCFRGPFWKRALLLISTIPVTLAVESLQVAATGILSASRGVQLSGGLAHDIAEWTVCIIVLVLLWGEMKMLRNTGAGAPPLNAKPPSSEKNIIFQRHTSMEDGGNKDGFSHYFKFATAVILLGATFAALHLIDFRKEFPPKQPFAQFPLHIGAWEGTPRHLDAETVQELHLSDYTMIDFRRAGEGVVGCYVAYCAKQRKGESIHTPATCLPGSGWVFKDAGAIALSTGVNGKHPIVVSRAFIQQSNSRQLIYYWFPQRGRILTNLFQLKFYTFWDAITRGRTDGALVRLITPVGEFESQERADARMQDFFLQLAPVLDKYLPN
ncbi:MAG: VPLPA-CTERM-specific exosortase XrtD [Syntrophobacteraceae bacterium]